MRFALACAIKDLRRFRRDPILLGVWLGMPLFAALMVYLVFGGESVVPRGLLLVADEDDSVVSSLFAGSFSQGPLGEMITVEKVTFSEGQERMDRGEASALLRIPKGFGTAVLNSTPTQLKLITNPTQNILPEMVTETVSILGEGVFYLQTLAGDRIRSLAGERAPQDFQVAEAAVAFNRLGTAVTGYLNPLRIELVTEAAPSRGMDTSKLGAAFLRSMLFMAVLFVGLGFSGEVWKEQRQGVLRRLLVTPGRTEAFLTGRLMALATVLSLAAACGFGVGYKLIGTPPARLVAAAVFVVAAGLAIYLLLQLLVMLAPGEKASSVLANLFVFPLAMAGGSFFPFELMPAWLAAVGRWTPNGWAVTQTALLLDGRAGPSEIGLMSAVVVVTGAAAFVLVSRRLRRGFVL